jgi:hypothetical protein
VVQRQQRGHRGPADATAWIGPPARTTGASALPTADLGEEIAGLVDNAVRAAGWAILGFYAQTLEIFETVSIQ